MWNDLLLNLIAEAAGIFITVVIIERYIDRRETQRWVSTKNQIYRALLKGLDDFLASIDLDIQSDDTQGEVYYFGNTPAVVTGSYKQLTFADVLNHLNSLKSQKNGKNIRAISLSPLINQLTTIVGISTPTLEPEFIEMLVGLDSSLKSLDVLIRNLNDRGIDDLNQISYELIEVILNVMATHVYLENKVDRIEHGTVQ